MMRTPVSQVILSKIYLKWLNKFTIIFILVLLDPGVTEDILENFSVATSARILYFMENSAENAKKVIDNATVEEREKIFKLPNLFRIVTPGLSRQFYF